MQFQVGFATDIGRKRSQNQDNGAALPELNLYLVADGMGGHRGGEIASAMAVETTRKRVEIAESSPDWEPETSLADAIRTANQVIFARAAEQPEFHGMGTTLTALLIRDNHLVIGHVGDSRCYFLRPSLIWQLTRDHSVVQEKLRAGLITREEARTDRMKNVITRSVGFEPVVSVETYRMDIAPGDTFLICSDGLSGLVSNEKLLEVVQKRLFEGNDPDTAVRELIQAANENGGDDNITAVLIRALPTEAQAEKHKA